MTSDVPNQGDLRNLFPDFPSQEQINTFYAAVGRAIAAWQNLEISLYEIYRAATLSEVPSAEAAAFFSLGAFRTQLRFVDAAYPSRG